MSQLTHIPGSWQFSGDWLGHYKLIDTDQDLGDPIAASRNIVCPMCEYPEAIHISRLHGTFPLMYWCPACESVWAGMWPSAQTVASICGRRINQQVWWFAQDVVCKWNSPMLRS